ncbi:MAG: polysaccharide deacetylase family protein [Kangiellaceae bacterium]|nr:polysaccharide deacetylase family protein [Kangiellaceae bacterium]
MLEDQVIANKEDSRTITGQTSVSEVIESIKVLNKFYKIISIEKAVELLSNGDVKAESAVLTFDDGFKDNFKNLYPVLKKYNIPATFYINASVIGTNKSLWFQAVINFFFAIKEQEINIPLTGESYDLSSASKRYQAAFGFMRYLQANHKPEEFHSVIDEIAGEKCLPVESDYHMSWEELEILANDPLITIGAHSYNHYPLSFCSEDLSNFEISESITSLEKKLNIKIRHFSYPRGHIEDFNEHHIACLKSNSVISGVSTIRGVNRVGEDMHRLKRVGFPQNISKDRVDFLWHIGGIPQMLQPLKSSK